MSEASVQTMTTVQDCLKAVKASGARVYYRLNPGNSGDAVIAMGTLRLFAEAGLEFEIINDADEANALSESDVLIMAGGGYLVPFWHGGATFFDQIGEKRRCKLVLLPQSVLDAERQLRMLRKDDVLFLRGRQSYEYAKSLDLEATVLVDNDCAFSADGQEILAYKPPFPSSLRDVARYGLIGYHFIRSRFTGSVYAYRADAERGASTNAPVINDIGRICTFGMENLDRIRLSAHWLLRVLSWYDIAYTDRLHVMVSRLLIGRKVIVRPLVYSKIQEVLDLSIKDNERLRSLVEFRDW